MVDLLLDPAVAIGLFVVSAAVVVSAGIVLARAADEIAVRTRLGGLFIGVLALGTATSLPEVLTNVSAAAIGAPDLAVADLFGANMANMATLAVVDLVHRGRVWPSVRLTQSIVAAVAIALTAATLVGIGLSGRWRLGWIGAETALIAAAYLVAMVWIRRASQRLDPRARAVGEFIVATRWSRPSDGGSVAAPLVRFILGAVAVLLFAPLLALSAKEIAEGAGLAQTLVGAAMLAIATSMPELVAAVAAARIGAHDLAVGNLFGSAAFNMAIVLPADVAYGSGPILGAVSREQILPGSLAIILMALALASIVHRERPHLRRIAPDVVLVLAVYGLGLGLLGLVGANG